MKATNWFGGCSERLHLSMRHPHVTGRLKTQKDTGHCQLVCVAGGESERVVDGECECESQDAGSSDRCEVCCLLQERDSRGYFQPYTQLRQPFIFAFLVYLINTQCEMKSNQTENESKESISV